MDDALVQEVKSILVEFFNVLILVLMDDALVQFKAYFEVKFTESLNPCFNG